MFRKKGILRNFAKFTGKHLFQSLFWIKLQASGLTQAFSCEFCKICRNTFFYKIPTVATSGKKTKFFRRDETLHKMKILNAYFLNAIKKFDLLGFKKQKVLLRLSQTAFTKVINENTRTLWGLFKVINKDTRTTSMTSFLCLFC